MTKERKKEEEEEEEEEWNVEVWYEDTITGFASFVQWGYLSLSLSILYQYVFTILLIPFWLASWASVLFESVWLTDFCLLSTSWLSVPLWRSPPHF